MVQKLLRREFTEDLSWLKYEERAKFEFTLKSRDTHIEALQDPKAEFDLLIVGGGCNGTGVAIDAASRGLRVAVIDSFDFGSGTSSRSTKLAHGGIRYLE